MIYNDAVNRAMMKKATEESKVSDAIETVLSQIIDEWYERVAPHYITRHSEPAAGGDLEEELKRFHDNKGHRIKFNKDDLDFTYGLRSHWDLARYFIEISVNNKVSHFDYPDFRRRLLAHYRKMGNQQVPTPYELKGTLYREVFQLEPNPEEAFRVERRESRADIMRLSFRVGDRFIKCLASHPVSGKQLIEDYCVSPFRSLYAAVYRHRHR